MTVTLSVIIGRFQPIHHGHLALFRKAAAVSDQCLVLIGSAFRPRSEKNAFTWREREGFISGALNAAEIACNAQFLPLIDTLYDDRTWAGNVRTAIDLHMRRAGLARASTRIVLIGHDKDDSSRYLRWFPDYASEYVQAEHASGQVLNATDLRRALFLDQTPAGDLARFGGQEVAQVRDWIADHPEAAAQVRAEASYNAAYRARYDAARTALGHDFPADCADAVVVQNGHVLLVERGQAPGQGLFALPGGHLQKETARAAAVRELIEETRLDMPRRMLDGRIVASKVFDHPDRSERGWVRTEAFRFDLIDGKPLERVKGADDAKRAFWLPISQLTPDVMFEDHFDIIQALVPHVPFAYASVLMAQMH